MSKVTIIVAMADNGAIGRGGDLLVHLREDLRRFKALTMGHPIVMGRKTFESLPKGALPGRTNIVVSRHEPDDTRGAIWCTTIDDAMATAAAAPGSDEIFVIGGGEIYRQTIDMADEMQITAMHFAPEDADTYFPAIDKNQWTLIEEIPGTDANAPVPYTFCHWQRNSIC